METIPEYVDNLPSISGFEETVKKTLDQGAENQPLNMPFGDGLKSTAAIALHMHQPLIPAGGEDLRSAEIISNLQHMLHGSVDGDRYNASIFRDCYKRMGDFIPQLIDQGKSPRVMLEYSGTLLHGLRKMGLDDVLDNLKRITCDERYSAAVEWLGCPWGHAVAPSTPVVDFRLHVQAWQQHFAGIFGLEALKRVRGFSPSEMALPNHPDVAYEFVKTLVDCGFHWVLVQEHSVEQPKDGWGPEQKHIPHRLVCRNSEGKTASIVAFIKTQGSDTKLVAQMQPYYEAKGLGRQKVGGHDIPQIVTQIADGENGGVMMNEFPDKFISVTHEASASETPLMNCGEYLEQLFSSGLSPEDLPQLQPIKQKTLWDHFQPGDGPEKLEKTIEKLQQEDSQFHMEGGSWTNNISWVRGYDNVLGPMERASSLFYEKVLQAGIPSSDSRYRQALFLLMSSQTSCYRYWGQGTWTEYGKEICRRVEEYTQNL